MLLKSYMLEIIGNDKDSGRIVIRYHIRAKGIPREKHQFLTIEKFQEMSNEGIPVKISNIRQFKRGFKDKKAPAVRTIVTDKEINREEWDGRIQDKEHNRWLPLLNDLIKEWRG